MLLLVVLSMLGLRCSIQQLMSCRVVLMQLTVRQTTLKSGQTGTVSTTPSSITVLAAWTAGQQHQCWLRACLLLMMQFLQQTS
jgi:hypothetical protein